MSARFRLRGVEWLPGLQAGRSVCGIDDGHVGYGVVGSGENRLAVFYGGSECFQLVAIRREPAEPLPPANASSADDEILERLRMVRA